MLSKIIFSKLTLVNLIYALTSAATLIFVINQGAIYLPDSEGYLEMVVFRSCGYPFFITLHRYLFGEYYISAIILTQFVATILASLFLINCIQKSVKLNKWLSVILFIAIILPIFTGIKTANLILSEAIAYPLYLFIIGNIISGIAHKQNKKFYYSLILTFILILVRSQFLFLIPVLLISVLLTYGKLLFCKKNLFLLIAIILIPFSAIAVDMTFHKLRHGYAVTTPWTGIQVATIPFFVSDKDDYLLFENENQQNYFKFLYNKLDEKKLLQSNLPKNIDEKHFFSENYCNISNFTISDDGLNFFNKNLSYEEKIILNDKMSLSITPTLIKNNLSKWITVYKKNVFKGIGEIHSLFFILMLLLLNSYVLYKKEEFVSKFIILLCFLTICNIVLVGIAEPVIERYTYYNNWIIIAIFLLLFQNYFQKKTNE